MQFDDYVIGVATVDIGKRIIARGAALTVGGVEQEYILPVFCPEACAGVKILALHIENHDRASPSQQIGNNDAGAFARAGWRFDQDMLVPAKGQETTAFATDDNSQSRAETMPLEFAFIGETCVPVKRSAARPQRIDQSAEQCEARSKAASHCTDDAWITAIIPDELRHSERVIRRHRQP